MADKMIRYQQIGELYDCSMTVKENVEFMKSNGIERISDRTLKRWMDENGLTRKRKKLKDEQLPELAPSP